MRREVLYDPIYFPPRPNLVFPDVIIPTHRQGWMFQTKDVARYVFEGYEDKVVIIDNLKAHFERGEKRIRLLDLPDRQIREIVNYWQVHDVGEIGLSSDRTTVDQRNDSASFKEDDQKEEEVARSLLTREDILLWEDFERAKLLVEGKTDPMKVKASPEAVMARVIDAIDGEMIFHYWFTELQKELGQKEVYEFFPDGVFVISFPRKRRYTEAVRSLKLPQRYIDLTDQMFDEVIAFARIAGQKEV